MFALPWFVLETTDSAAQTALVAATQMAAFLLAAIAGGVVVDRFGPKWLSVVSDLASGLSIAAIPILMHTIGLRLWQVLVLAFLGAILDSPGGNARYGIVTDLIDLTGWRPERVYSAFSSADGVARIFGPILAGGLIAWIGAVNALWVDAASFAVSALLITVLVPLTTRPLRPEVDLHGRCPGGVGISALPCLAGPLLLADRLREPDGRATGCRRHPQDRSRPLRLVARRRRNAGRGRDRRDPRRPGLRDHRSPADRLSLDADCALVLLFVSLLSALGLFPVPVSVAALALTGFGFGIMVPNNQTVFRRITDVEFRGRLLGLRDAVVGVSSPMMVVIVGLLLDVSPVRLVIFPAGADQPGVVVWYVRERVFESSMRPSRSRAGCSSSMNCSS